MQNEKEEVFQPNIHFFEMAHTNINKNICIKIREHAFFIFHIYKYVVARGSGSSNLIEHLFISDSDIL